MLSSVQTTRVVGISGVLTHLFYDDTRNGKDAVRQVQEPADRQDRPILPGVGTGELPTNLPGSETSHLRKARSGVQGRPERPGDRGIPADYPAITPRGLGLQIGSL